MSLHETFGQPLLTFPDAEKSPLSIRAKALVFVDPRSRQLRNDLEQLAPRALPVLIRGEPLRASGKVLLADKVLTVALAAGTALFNDPVWSRDFARAAGAALAKPVVRVDVPAMAVSF